LEEDDDDSSYDDLKDRNYVARTNRTKSGRGDGFRPRTRSVAGAKRDGPETPATKARAAKKRKVLAATHSHQLSKATLTRINQQFGEAVWTADHIRQWSKTSLKKRVSRRHSLVMIRYSFF
jgi:hypothetical protein